MTKKKKPLLGILLFTLLTFSGIAFPFMGISSGSGKEINDGTRNIDVNESDITKAKRRSSHIQDEEKITPERQQNATSVKQGRISTQGETWKQAPGDWWDSDWMYRQNVSLNGTTANQTNWPVNVFVNFRPPAHYDSIRVINASDNRVLPYQPWNLTYVNESYLDSATIAFKANISTTRSRTVQVYWSSTSKPLPSYSHDLVLGSEATPLGLRYTVSSVAGWTVTLSPTGGGTIKNITHNSGKELGHSDWLNFGISKNPNTTYNGYWGEANTNTTNYEWRGIVENQDDLTSHFKQTIFLTYEVRGIPLKNATGDTLAHVNYTYQFYKWGWTVNESITWETSETGANYWMNGWAFDQNVRLWNYKDAMFNYTVTNSGTQPLPVKGWLDRFEDGTAEDWYTDNWQVSDARVYEGNFSFGCPGTGETYGYNAYGEAISTSIIVPSDPFSLEYWVWYDLGPDDDVTIYTKELGGSWTQQEQYTGSSGWIHENLTVSDYSAGDRIKVRFELNDEVEGWSADTVGEGVYIDQFEATPKDGPEWKVYSDTGAWNYTAFLNGKSPRGIGKVRLNNSSTNVTLQNDEWLWQNYGNETRVQDYILWARNCTINHNIGSQLSSKYAIVPWSPSGSTVSERLAGFNNTQEALWNEVNKKKKKRERFKIKLTITIEDKDGYGIKGAKVGLQDAHLNTTNQYNYSGTTNGKGEVTFDVERVWYNISANVSSAGKQYNGSIGEDFSSLPFTQFSASRPINFTDLVNLLIRAQAPDGTNIQYGLINVRNTTPTWNLTALTNLTGWVNLHLPTDDWTLRINATNNEPGWDYFDLYNQSEDRVANENESFTFPLTTKTTYLLEDLNITEAPASSELKLYETPSSFERYWGENISGMVILQNTNGTPLNGTIPWFIYNPEEELMLDYLDLNFDAENSNQGNISFELNTSLLPAGKTFRMKFIGTVSEPGYNKPVPMYISITVDPVLTDMKIDKVWNDGSGGNFWDEKLEIFVEYETYQGASVSGATVTSFLSKGTFNNTFPDANWTETTDGYKLTFSNFHQDGAGIYSLRVNASKANFSTAEELEGLMVYERPTTFSSRSYIETPWTYNYTFTAKYWDERYDEAVKNATYTRGKLESVTYDVNISYSILDQADHVIKKGKMFYQKENKYYSTTVQINGSSFDIGTYLMVIHASKICFENKVTQTTFHITERSTTLSADPPRVKRIYSYGIKVRFDYEDGDYAQYPFGQNSSIAGASEKRYTITGPEGFNTLTGTLKDLENGSYLFSMSTKTINRTGTFTLLVEIAKDHYTRQTREVTLIIEHIPTTTSTTKKEVTKNYDQDITVDVNWTNTANNSLVENPTNHSWWYSSDLHGTLTALNGSTTQLNGTYRFSLKASHLGLGTHTVTIYLQKPFHVNQTLKLTIEVEPIPTVASLSNENPAVPWGDLVNLSLVYRDVYGSFLPRALEREDINTTIPEQWWSLDNRSNRYFFLVNTSGLNTTGYHMKFVLNVAHYQPKSISGTLTVQPLRISGKYKGSPLVEKNPLTGETSTEENTFEVILRDESHGRALSDALVEYRIVNHTEWKHMAPGEYPGSYTATIDWSTYEVRKRAEEYKIDVRISRISVDGKPLTVSKDTMRKLGDIKETFDVNLDYYGGRMTVAGFIIPRIWFYVAVGIALLIASYGSIQLYSYLTTPPEVRTLNKLIRQVEEENFEYPRISREEQFKEEIDAFYG